MTASELINSTKPLLSGLKIGEDSDALLSFLNMAKNQLASDCLLWTDGEEIVMTDERTYTLATIPHQIIDIYDNAGIVRERGANDMNGYYQTSPSKITINVPNKDRILYVNYYITPDDYALNDTLDIPTSLLNVVQCFISYKAHSVHKGELNLATASRYKSEYQQGIQDYIMKTDTLSSDSLYFTDMIQNKGLV